MYLQVSGRILPLSGSLFNALAMPLAVIVAVFTFADGRKRAFNRHFLLGAICLLGGSFFFISAKTAGQKFEKSIENEM
ncbi:hypothetical protein HMPREF1054_1791 [Haemophilus paraphrohaemolyticus HK411]|uniref:Uncharacterized protein n=1 Tax=Haemophilus paraphrohaemolyticus HK411 TaxID=1095743 RepID=I2NP11_9PAST|nr:hypothetical protein HMPREF1054_1791 [Haemophilus paraphrohaemolyticus HK411]